MRFKITMYIVLVLVVVSLLFRMNSWLTNESQQVVVLKSSRRDEFKLVDQVEQEVGDCKDATSATKGRFDGHWFEFRGAGGCASLTKWIESKEEACALLSKFDIYIIGQSTERRLYYALQEMAAGNEWLFRNGIPEEQEEHIFDRKGPLKKIAKDPNCLRIKTHYEKTWKGIAGWVQHYVEKPSNDRQTVVLFQSGLYALAAHEFQVPALAKQLRTFLTQSKVLEKAKRNGAILMWRPPVPVNATHDRFLKYYPDANQELMKWRDKSNEMMKQACVVDALDQILEGSRTGTIRWEDGQEWKPPQIGGIHLKDNGRKIVAQIFVNALRFCHNQNNK